MSQNGENNRLQIMRMTDKKYMSFFFRNNQEERIKKIQMEKKNEINVFVTEWQHF